MCTCVFLSSENWETWLLIGFCYQSAPRSLALSSLICRWRSVVTAFITLQACCEDQIFMRSFVNVKYIIQKQAILVVHCPLGQRPSQPRLQILLDSSPFPHPQIYLGPQLSGRRHEFLGVQWEWEEWNYFSARTQLISLACIYMTYTEQERGDFTIQSVFANYIFNGDRKIICHASALGQPMFPLTR